MIIIPMKNGYNWEYTLFSDKPRFLDISNSSAFMGNGFRGYFHIRNRQPSEIIPMTEMAPGLPIHQDAACT